MRSPHIVMTTQVKQNQHLLLGDILPLQQETEDTKVGRDDNVHKIREEKERGRTRHFWAGKVKGKVRVRRQKEEVEKRRGVPV